MRFDLLIKCIEGQVTILIQARNLNNYVLASISGYESQAIVRQVSQKIQVAVGGLIQIIEDIRAIDPGPGHEQGTVDADVIMQFLTKVERADLGQLQHSYNELSIARDLVGRFRRRLVDLGQQRKAAGDERGQS